LENELDKWIYLLKNIHGLDQIPKYLDKRIFQKIFNIAEMGRLSREERIIYEFDLKRKSDYENGLAYAAVKAGYEKSVEIAIELKKDNFDVAKIAQLTKLSIEEVENL